jgi:hypothetical protein
MIDATTVHVWMVAHARRRAIPSRTPPRHPPSSLPGVQRRALGILFAALALVFAATAVAALLGAGGGAKGWVVAVGALALGGWLGSLAMSAFRRS